MSAILSIASVDAASKDGSDSHEGKGPPLVTIKVVDLIPVNLMQVTKPSLTTLKRVVSKQHSSRSGVAMKTASVNSYCSLAISPADSIKNWWASKIEQIPIAGDKIDPKKIGNSKYYEGKKDFVCVMKIRKCVTISFKEDEQVLGAVILTRRAQGVEVEYGKHIGALHVKGVAVGMLQNLLRNFEKFTKSVEFMDGVTKENLYAEVCDSEGQFNFASYITLLRSGFVPIRREGGDGIKFVLPSINAEVLPDILEAFKNYETAKKTSEPAKDLALDLNSSFEDDPVTSAQMKLEDCIFAYHSMHDEK